MISAWAGSATCHSSLLRPVFRDTAILKKTNGLPVGSLVEANPGRSECRSKLHVRSVTETDTYSVTIDKDVQRSRGSDIGGEVSLIASRNKGTKQPESSSKEAAEPAPLSREQSSVAAVISLVDEIAERLTGNDANGKLVRALAKAALVEFGTSAEELRDVWLNLPPRELTDTLPPALLADHDSKFVQVDGVTVHYKECFNGLSTNQSRFATGETLPTLVLLHGFSGSVFSWRLVMESLAEAVPGGCRVVAFDRPPFGLTSRPLEVSEGSNPYTNEGAARLTLGLMDALGVRQAVLVGHSAGASIAVEAALQSPERIEALVLAAPSVFLRNDFLRKADLQTQLRLLYTRTLLQVPGAGLNYVRNQYIKRREAVLRGESFGYYDETLATEEVKQGYVRPMKAQDWDKGALQLYRSFGFTPVGDRIHALNMPVCIIQGREDRAVTEPTAQHLRQQLAEVTSVEYHVLEKCGHLPQEEHPKEFTSLVSDFLARLYGASNPSH